MSLSYTNHDLFVSLSRVRRIYLLTKDLFNLFQSSFYTINLTQVLSPKIGTDF